MAKTFDLKDDSVVVVVGSGAGGGTLSNELVQRGINVVPLYAVSQDAATTIVDLAATMGMDFLVIGASQRPALVKLLRGSVATNVAQQLPESIHMIIYG